MIRALTLLLACSCSKLVGAEVVSEKHLAVTGDTARAAIEKAIPWLESGSRGSADERTCFTCHNQALPVFALTEAKKHGFEVDQDNLTRQIQHTWKHLESGKDRYAEGRGQGGQVMTAGYALWTLDVAEHEPDDVTKAVAHYLLEFQKQRQHWVSTSKQRPPSAGSDFTATYVALRGLNYFGTAEQSEEIRVARESIAKWIIDTEPVDTEDRVFRLRSFQYIDVDKSVVQDAVQSLLNEQHGDGGWSQRVDMESDTYATATVMTALLEAGHVETEHDAIVNGAEFLLNHQLVDGTWRVETHADPIQEYFESGFPHGRDQFISIAATSWAVLALTEFVK